MELKRIYNTVLCDSATLSHIVLVKGNEFKRFPSDNVYQLKDDSDKSKYLNGQDYEINLDGFKKGNKTLFKDGLKPIHNRLVPYDSIPWNIKQELKVDRHCGRAGNFLFISVDSVEIKDSNIDVGSKYTSKKRTYYFKINDVDFFAYDNVYSVNESQAHESIYENLREDIKHHNYPNHREYLKAQLYLYDAIHDGRIEIYSSEIEENSWGDKSQLFTVSLIGEDQIYSKRINPNRQEEIENFMKKFNKDYIITDYPEAFYAFKN